MSCKLSFYDFNYDHEDVLTEDEITEELLVENVKKVKIL